MKPSDMLPWTKKSQRSSEQDRVLDQELERSRTARNKSSRLVRDAYQTMQDRLKEH